MLFRSPKPPHSLILDLFERDVHAAIDLSDGLSSEAMHLAVASGVAIVLDASRLAPSADQIALGARVGINPMDWVLHGGEDHSLLMAVPVGFVLPEGIKEIGRVEIGDGICLDGLEGRKPLAPNGWRHA